MTLGRIARQVATAIIVISIPAAAQDAAPASGAWSFANLMNGFCVAFLVDSGDARALLPDEAFPVRASAVERLNPALARAIADQPEYANWIPGQFCVYRFGRADVNGSELVAKAGEGEAFGWVGLVARASADQPAGSLVAIQLFTSDWRAQRAAETGRLQLKQVKMQFGQAPKSTDDRYVIQLGKTTVVWDGRAGADSTVPSEPEVHVFLRQARSGAPSLARFEVRANERRSMIGALIIEGKDRLAKALRKSPIRFAGPLLRGGQGSLSIQ